ncbi:MAG: S41 family peptidase [Acidobacteriota bacterium]|nr:S41 family peptidase [Acidobacteriota bacterium]
MKQSGDFGRGRTILLLCSLALMLPLAGGTLSRALAQGKDKQEDSIYKQLSVFTEVLSLIRRNYVDETELGGLFAGALDGTVDALDPLATYVPPERIAVYHAARQVGRSHSGVAVARQRGITYVLAVEPSSPGAEAELAAGDILSEIDGRSTREMSLWEVESLLAGEPGTELELKTLRRGQTLESQLRLASFERHGSALELRDDLVVITIPRFEEGLAGELETLLAQASGRDRMLIDLRGAAGGTAESAFRSAAHFVQGSLGKLLGREGTITEFADEKVPEWNGRMVVLTDRSSQGASEVFAAVLVQAAGAELVGERTFGHAGRRAIITLSNGAEIHFSDAFYAGPDGAAIDSPLMPKLVVSEVSRRLSEADVPFAELMMRRAIERLLSEPLAAEEAAEAAA